MLSKNKPDGHERPAQTRAFASVHAHKTTVARHTAQTPIVLASSLLHQMDKSHNEKNDFCNRENNSDKEQLPTTGHGYGSWALGTWKSAPTAPVACFQGRNWCFTAWAFHIASLLWGNVSSYRETYRRTASGSGWEEGMGEIICEIKDNK